MDSQILCSSSSFIETNTILKMSTRAKIFTFLLCLLFYYNKNNAFGIIHSVRAAPDHQIKCVEKERQALLKFKQEVVDKYDRLSSWESEEFQTDCCKWHGVYCDNRTGNVITLNLQGLHDLEQPLMGQISISLLELKYLEHLDLSYNDFVSNIPSFFGSFTRLTYLDLSFAGFYGKVPHQLGNLSSLKTFHLKSSYSISNYSIFLYIDNIQWLSSLQSLTTLYLGSLTLNSDWAAAVSSLSRLRVFSMRVCELPYLTPSLNSINYSAPLDIIDLYHNNLNSSVIYSWLFNFNNSVTEITLSGNNLHGPLPDGFANIVSLVHLDLSDNNLEGQMLEFLKNFSRRVSRTLEYLNLDGNLMRGPLPDTIVEFQSLKELRLQWNELNGSIPKAFGELPNLTVLDLSGNNLEGVISQSHLRNLSHLQMLDLSFNSGLALRFRLDWIPHFQLQVLRLRNCKLGPYFPKWIQTQKNIYEIDLSTTGISDEIPSWFWDQISGVKELDLSNNRMDNTLPDLYTKVSDLVMLNLSLNHFKGPIPRLPNTIEMVDLSKNKLSGEITFLCNSPLDYIFYLDLSDNQLSGELSDCWAHLENLEFLNLNNNNLSGKIPTSMGSLPLLKTLLLRKNSFTKELPRSWQYSESLNFIELGENKLSGAIPEWLGRNLSQLIVLDLSWNNFSGSVPQNICNLSLIQILDLSGNKISGRIPKCISNFSAMIQEWSAMQNLSIGLVFSSLHNSIIHMFSFEAFLTWKGTEAKYKSTLPFVKGIDLSSNRLTGDIPLEVSSLVGLVGLNLSRNHLTGILPPEIGKLKSLDFLDLSRNRIFGEIPSSLSQISLLGMLDLSYNNLTGRIPTGTQLQSFDASSYANNSGLCGEPLTRVCPEDELPQDPNLEGGAEEHEDKFITTGFYLSTALGFIIGFWGICGSLILNRSLRYAFFEFINSMQDWLYVIIALKLSRCCRGGFMNK